MPDGKDKIMHVLTPALAAILLLSTASCSTLPSTPLTPPDRPDACMAPCPDLPRLGGDYDSWVFELIDTYGQCRRQHEACRRGQQ